MPRGGYDSKNRKKENPNSWKKNKKDVKFLDDDLVKMKEGDQLSRLITSQ